MSTENTTPTLPNDGASIEVLSDFLMRHAKDLDNGQENAILGMIKSASERAGAAATRTIEAQIKAGLKEGKRFEQNTITSAQIGRPDPKTDPVNYAKWLRK